MRAKRRWLWRLSDRAGILPEFTDANGNQLVTTDATRIALLSALGWKASTEREARCALEEWINKDRRRIVEPVRVVRVSKRKSITVPFSAREAGDSSGHVLELVEERGATHRTERRSSKRVGRATHSAIRLSLPRPLPIGYHRLTLNLCSSKGDRTLEQRLMVVPPTCPDVRAILRGTQHFGLCANLYSVRSRRNWGVGDFSDLAELCGKASQGGAAFLGLNPLHATPNRELECSPYSPLSRLYRNLAYLDVAAVPELNRCAVAQKLMRSTAFQRELQLLRSAPRIEYEQIANRKLQVLRLLHQEFRNAFGSGRTARGAAYSRYLQREGKPMDTFATFCALDAHWARSSGKRRPWQQWPIGFRSPQSGPVAEFQRTHPHEIDLYRYIQFELDRQLAAAAEKARKSGMRLGLYQDLAIGVSRQAADVWAEADLFVTSASLGAPPDDYAPQGQDWELPPLHPFRLRESGYDYWIRTLRGALAHSGALRIDHIMGLLRQFWIPFGRPASEGAYLRFPWDELIGILALESTRHRALVIGEDLGTVPAGFSCRLARHRILSTRVLFFERKRGGRFRSARHYSKRAFVSATTHDLGPLQGYCKGIDLEIRRTVGVISHQRELEKALQQRQRDKDGLIRLLRAHHLLDGQSHSISYSTLLAAVHEFLRRTPSPLIGLMLDDLSGETIPVNLPGVPPTLYASWVRPMSKRMDELRSDLRRLGLP